MICTVQTYARNFSGSFIPKDLLNDGEIGSSLDADTGLVAQSGLILKDARNNGRITVSVSPYPSGSPFLLNNISNNGQMDFLVMVRLVPPIDVHLQCWNLTNELRAGFSVSIAGDRTQSIVVTGMTSPDSFVDASFVFTKNFGSFAVYTPVSFQDTENNAQAVIEVSESSRAISFSGLQNAGIVRTRRFGTVSNVRFFLENLPTSSTHLHNVVRTGPRVWIIMSCLF